MTNEQIQKVVSLARELVGEIEWISMGDRTPQQTMIEKLRVRPRPEQLDLLRDLLDDALIALNEAAVFSQQEDELQAAGLVHQLIAASMFVVEDGMTVAVKFSRYPCVFARAKQTDIVPPLKNQLAGEKTITQASLN